MYSSRRGGFALQSIQMGLRSLRGSRESMMGNRSFVASAIAFALFLAFGSAALAALSGVAGNSAITAADGKYTIGGIAPGNYSVTYSKPGYASQTMPNVVITADGTTTRDASLVAAATPTLLPIYRFYNKKNGSHFYTSSDVEKDNVIKNLSSTYLLEGVAYSVNTANPANSAPLHRFYNKKNGSHFYTASEVEKSNVIRTLSATYAYDGPAYNVCATQVAGSTQIYRFYNKKNGSHFYTASEVEKANVQNTLSKIYSLDGAAFFVAP
jgi:hypothetical protein